MEDNCSRYRKTLLNGGRGYFAHFLLRTRGIPNLPEGIVQDMLSPPSFGLFPNRGNLVEEGEDDFGEVAEGEVNILSEGRYGDHPMVKPFQCDMFHIRNIEGRNLTPRDEGLLIITEKENMDACWRTEPSTVWGKLEYLRRMRRDA